MFGVSSIGNGFCRYGTNEYDPINGGTTITIEKCQRSCQTEDGCTAYAFTDSNGWCDRYRGGPYIYATGAAGVKCFVQGIYVYRLLIVFLFTYNLYHCKTNWPNFFS